MSELEKPLARALGYYTLILFVGSGFLVELLIPKKYVLFVQGLLQILVACLLCQVQGRPHCMRVEGIESQTPVPCTPKTLNPKP